ncbi:hypothetical protein J7F03_31270 [Streptomyces sp. ISL-43]|uniref:hypothetical protein n=1 Tax=Streptomyces sp. ISL-43 TaxID=2819183 RepID=UPI001BE73D89|nr:hypothetical protein [Streptomyces sp. ISL-43]MBT2451466.1 hypothetical protein [Streptomyces sp. ISL-43]
MTDMLTPYAIAALVAACALLYGMVRISGAASSYLLAQAEVRRLEARAKARQLDPPQPVCGCGHHFSFHDPEARSCHHQNKLETSYLFGGITGNELVACDCRQYVGPEPLPTVYAPEL